MKFFLLFIALLIAVLSVRLAFFYFFPIHLVDGQTISFSATLFEDPKVVGNNQQFSLRFGNFWQSIPIRITTNSDTEFSYGETLSLIGKVKYLLLKNKSIVVTIQNPKIVAKNGVFLPLFGALRQQIISLCENNFSQPYSGLLVGIIFGIKSLLTQGITTSFRITGLSHIVAASGMNVTLVLGFLFGLFGAVLKRRITIVVSLLGLLGYVALSGFDASILRAAFMGSIAFGALLFGRQYSALYVLLLVVMGMLLWDPLLLTDIGFQLSVLATTGILVLKPLIPSTIIGDDFGTTLAAQVFTLPIILGTFGQYALTSIIANLLVLWTIPILMIGGSLTIFTGLIFAPLGKIIFTLLIPLLWYMTEVTKFFSSHSWTVQIDSLPITFIVGYYLLLVSFILILRKKRLATSD